MSEMKSRHLFDLTIQLHPIVELGATPAGERRIVPVSGGQFTGERLRGEALLNAGSDLLLARADGSFSRMSDWCCARMMARSYHDLPRCAARLAGGKFADGSRGASRAF